jgi:aconitate hydratase
MVDSFGALTTLAIAGTSYRIHRLAALEEQGIVKLERLPFSIRVLLESLLRQQDDTTITARHVSDLASWRPHHDGVRPSVPFRPARVVMQDFTGVPAVVDLGAMRSALAAAGGDPSQVNPSVPVDLVIDHSVQVDHFGTAAALEQNAEIEFRRNAERYEFLHWGQGAFSNFSVVPPATGIVHQVNLEYLAQVVIADASGDVPALYPDTLVGTDSHTTMINGLGVLGWGVGGIEAEAALLGQPIDLLTPDVVGVKLTGARLEGVTATDMTLAVTELLRNHGVVGKFVEFFGAGLSSMSLPDRATIANMAPEYGATMGFFPVDDETLRYLRLSGRPDELVTRVETYCKEQQLFRTDQSPDPRFSELLELDLASVEPALAGPKRPQDRVLLREMKSSFAASLAAPKAERGFAVPPAARAVAVPLGASGSAVTVGHGSVVIAAITSCTNTSNPSVMLAAGLVAQKARARGLQSAPQVKTSLAPGSTVVTEYLRKAQLLQPLAELGFDLVGYGCTTCIGNSGPLPDAVEAAIGGADLVAASVLSGNRNFEGRVHAQVKANYLASPPLVVAYALAGTVDIDLTQEPLGVDAAGTQVYLRDIWPSDAEVAAALSATVGPQLFRDRYADVQQGNATWNAIGAGKSAANDTDSALYQWRSDSMYIQEPPFFTALDPEPGPIAPLADARVLAVLGDSITTDHISPAGAIPADGPAGRYLQEHGVAPADFNSFGSRRGNHEVMMRGTFANVRLKNLLADGKEGGHTTHVPSGEASSIFDAAMRYRDAGVPLIILAGAEYGSGSSRDWAAKGPMLLGVRAVIAESYERIHRSNLVGMGVLPLQFEPGSNAAILGLTGKESFTIEGLADDLTPRAALDVVATTDAGQQTRFTAIVRIDTTIEVDYYRNGGILHTVLRRMLAA